MTPQTIASRRESIEQCLPTEIVITDPDVMAGYTNDESQLTISGEPAAVLTPRNTQEVADCLRLCHQLAISVSVRGAGTGLAGGANAASGGVVLSTHRMNRLIEIDPVQRLAVVEPGLITADITTAAADYQLAYPPDPGSIDICSIGGNVATNAGGMCCVKYGVTGDYVAALEVVLADGRLLRTGTRTRKGVAGYNLSQLFVGSEGTLGVITEITLRLVPAAEPAHTLVATFDALSSAGAAVEAIIASGLDCSAIELLDTTTLAAVSEFTQMRLEPAAAMLLIRSDVHTASEVLVSVEEICQRAGASDVARGDDPAEGNELMHARRAALPALETLAARTGRRWLLDDVCVPVTKVAALVSAIEQVAVTTGLTIGVFGHAGDGNLHPTILFDPEDAATARSAFDQITRAALDLGGTITGEHGVGQLKAAWLAADLDPVALAAQAAIRSALDPAGIFNTVIPPITGKSSLHG